MENYQQQQKAGQKGAGSPAYQYQTGGDSEALALCPNCNAELPEGAIFCPECGFSKGLICPKCGKNNPPTADICEICQTWLLHGKCKFCYAAIEDGGAFCPECGKPQAGIPCPNCGNLSTFDFCTKCGKPVTPEAIAEIQAVQNEAPPAVAGIQAELAELDALINSEQESEVEQKIAPPARKSLFSDKQMAAIKKTAADAGEQQRTEEIQKAEEERRQKVQQAQAKKDELQKKLLQDLKEQSQQIAGKKFGSNQAARRFHSARRHPDAIGWHCNYAEVVHLYENGGPNECHDPSQGGCDFFGTMDDLFKNEYGCYQPK